MTLRDIRPAVAALGLLVGVYLPAFALASFVRPGVELAIPLIMSVSLFVAMLLVICLARRGSGVSAFGFNAPRWRDLSLALLLGAPLALAAIWLCRMIPSKPPFDVSKFPAWMLGLYFVFGAPIQEEIIFRGLIQSYLQDRWQVVPNLLGDVFSPAVGFTAVLFSLVHVGSGFAVVLGAVALSLVAGELRRRSGSLLPAMLVHAQFNLADALWPGA
jgi:membrane protease YdiL (CAAX protease family)